MLHAEHEDVSHDGLIADILTPLIVASALFALLTLALIAGSRSDVGISSFIFPAILLLNTLIAQQAQQHNKLFFAATLMSYTIGLLPIFTVFTHSPSSNSIMFIAPLGVLLGTLILPFRVGFTIAGIGIAMLIVSIFMNPTVALLSQALLILLLLGFGALGCWASDTILGTIAWALDTSAKSERREKLLRQTQHELQEAIYERERLNNAMQITNRDLEAARAAAEAAYQSKSSFMARMSHELRTPLNLIIGFSNAMLEHPEMYEMQPLPEIYQADISAIRASGQHLLGLINDILDLAKVEAGRLELHKAPFQIEALLEEMYKTAGALLLNRPVVLTRDWPSPLPTIVADETRIRQVLLNLISNASKFTDEGEISLGARANDKEVLIWVRDSGIGIAPEDQARMFGEFEQTESDDSRQRGGTGLGLSICRWLVEMHNGKIGLESTPGIGSTFFFTLPLNAETTYSHPTKPTAEPVDNSYAELHTM